jgi:hypothetical protein
VRGLLFVDRVMTDSKLFPIDIVDFRAEHYSHDGQSIVVSFATAQSAERRAYALPVKSLYAGSLPICRSCRKRRPHRRRLRKSPRRPAPRPPTRRRTGLR